MSAFLFLGAAKLLGNESGAAVDLPSVERKKQNLKGTIYGPRFKYEDNMSQLRVCEAVTSLPQPILRVDRVG